MSIKCNTKITTKQRKKKIPDKVLDFIDSMLCVVMPISQ